MSTNGTTVICDESGSVGLERTNFFPRQLIGPDDLIQDQRYFSEKLRRHNRLLHGWGVVCGARVKAGEGCVVIVEPGYVLGPQGHEIVIDREVPVDLCAEDLDGNAVGPCGDVDPWCSGVRVERPSDRPLYVAVRYAECQSRPVRAHSGSCGCGCDEAECEYSRTRDSYAVKVLTELPDGYRPMPDPELWAECVTGRPPTCPDCPADPWVILADVTLSEGGTVDNANIDCRSHRRHVFSAARHYYLCGKGKKKKPGKLGATKRLMDAEAMESREMASVAVRMEDDSWTPLPAHFEVRSGETIGELIEREGDRAIEDAETGDTILLRELYALAGANPGTTIKTVAEALAPLEGLRVRTNDLRVVRGELEQLLAPAGVARLDTEHAGDPASAPDLPAAGLRGVPPRSALGRRIGAMTIGELATADSEALVGPAAKGLSPAKRDEAAGQVRELQALAGRVTALSRAWTGDAPEGNAH